MARLNVEVNPKIEALHEQQAQPVAPTHSLLSLPNALAGDKLNLEYKDGEGRSSSDGESEIPSKRPGSENLQKGSIWTGTNHSAVNKLRNSITPAPVTKMHENYQDQDDREEDDADDIARTINVGLSVKDPSDAATRQPGSAIWANLVDFGKGVGGMFGVGTPNAKQPAPESNISRKRATDVSEQTSADSSAPNADEEVPVHSQVTVAPKQPQRSPFVFRPLNKPTVSSTKGKPNPYDDFGETSLIDTITPAPKVSGRGRKPKPLVPRHKSRLVQPTSRIIQGLDRETPHEASKKPEIMVSDNEQEDDDQLRVSPQMEQSKRVEVVMNVAAPAKRVTRSNRYDIVESSDNNNAKRGNGAHSKLRHSAASERVSPEDAIDGIGSIVMSPSLTNITKSRIAARKEDNPAAGKLATSHSSKAREAPHNDAQNNTIRDSRSPDIIEKEPVAMEEQDVSTSTKILMNDKILEAMLDLMGRVGKVKGKEDDDRPALNIEHTSIGQAMKHITNEITSIYGKIKHYNSSEEPNCEAIDEQHDAVVVLLEKLEIRTSEILINQLGDPSGGGQNAVPWYRLNILKDLYIHIFPGLVGSLNAAANAYQREGQISTPDLEEVSRILKAMNDLLTAAANETEKPKGKGYAGIVKPARTLFVIVRKLYKECNDELQVRATAMKAAAFKAAAPERKRKREERALAEKKAEEEAYQEKLRRRHREAGASWQRQMELGMIPSSNQTIEEPLLSGTPGGPPASGSKPVTASQVSLAEKRAAKDREVARLESELHRVRQEARKLKRAEERLRQGLVGDSLRGAGDSMHDDDDEVDEERLHMFGENNTAPSATTPWAMIELETLVDGLRQHRGRDRYQIIATRLDRSYDEIFAKARELRVTMEEHLERKRQEMPRQYFSQLEDWIECIGMEF